MQAAYAVPEVDQLHVFVRSVVIRARHHAENLDAVALSLAGAVLWKKQPGTEIKVRRNVLWFVMGVSRYVLAYVPGNGGRIELRFGTQAGKVLATFTNATPVADLMAVFDAIHADPTWEQHLQELNEREAA